MFDDGIGHMVSLNCGHDRQAPDEFVPHTLSTKAVVEAASGQRLADLTSDRLFQPIGIHDARLLDAAAINR